MPVYSVFCMGIIWWVFRLCPCWAPLCLKNLSMVGVFTDSIPRRRCGAVSYVWALLHQSCLCVEALQTLKSCRDWHRAHMPHCLLSVIVLTRKESSLCGREHQVLQELPVLWQFWSIFYQDLLKSCIKITFPIFWLLSLFCVYKVRGQLGIYSFHSVTFLNCSNIIFLQVRRTSKALLHGQ